MVSVDRCSNHTYVNYVPLRQISGNSWATNYGSVADCWTEWQDRASPSAHANRHPGPTGQRLRPDYRHLARLMLQPNAVEWTTLLVWLLGVVCSIVNLAQSRGKFRALITLLIAVVIPVIGSLFAIAILILMHSDRKRRSAQPA